MVTRVEETKSNKFDFNAARVFLTYPHFDISPSEFKTTIMPRLESYGVHKYVIGRETHLDGTPHIHALFCFATRLHTRSARFFDVGDRHPNVRKVENPDKVAAYIRKEGNFIEDYPSDIRGYRSHKKDQEEYKRDMCRKQLREPIPFELPNETMYTELLLHEKRRHYWFVSKPDWGKTTWVEETFAGRKIYKRTECTYPYDDYDGEQVIIFDDFMPKLVELLNVSNLYRTPTPVYGDTRYTKRYWEIGVNRVMIVLSNMEPCYANNDAFLARFYIINL